MGRLKTLAVGAVVAGVLAAVAVAANNTTGPSSSQAPYVLPVDLSHFRGQHDGVRQRLAA